MDNEGIYQVLPGNVTFLQACATTLAFEESTTLIESKALEAAPLEVSNSTSVALGLTFVIILPAAVLAARCRCGPAAPPQVRGQSRCST